MAYVSQNYFCCSFAAGVSESWDEYERVQSNSGWSPFNFFKEENFSQIFQLVWKTKSKCSFAEFLGGEIFSSNVTKYVAVACGQSS